MAAFEEIAALVGDRTRVRILDELLGGVALPAGALAARVGVAASTVSGHVARLEAGGLVVVERRGRRREVRLAGPEVAEALEALALLSVPERPVGLRQATRAAALREARSCYDHLAGLAGVALTDALVVRGALERHDGGLRLPSDADGVWAALGVDLAALRTGRRPLVRACLDWTERRPHLAGSVGAALLGSLLARGYVERTAGGRALRVTSAGRRGLVALGVRWDAVGGAPSADGSVLGDRAGSGRP